MGEPANTDLYERDFYAWTQVQARQLRALTGHNAVDVVHVAEEIADLGANQRNALASHLRLAFQHLILLAASPAADPQAHWAGEVAHSRDEIRQLLETSPSLQTAVDPDKAWRRALHTANEKRVWHGEPTVKPKRPCPLQLDDLASDELDVADLIWRVRRVVRPDDSGPESD